MDLRSLLRRALLASALCCATLSPTGTSLAAPFAEFVDPNPSASNDFGATVVPLSTGNVVITSSGDDAGGPNAGAVYLFNGATGALISTLRGSTAGDMVGSSGVTALTNGNFVVPIPSWDNGAIVDAGAVTWGSGTTGVSGVVSAANSLVGSSTNDGPFEVIVLSNGNYVVRSHFWNNGAITDAGAATWGNGTTGVSGVVSAANSLVGTTAGDQVSSGGVTALSNGNYVVNSLSWNNVGIVEAGAATWGSGTTGVTGVVSAANSLVGSTASDQVGAVTALANGNYIVNSPFWNNGAVTDAGAVTWGSGTTGVTGAVGAANSLVGSVANDRVGSGLVKALSNGNYVVSSPIWNNGAVVDAGAVTRGSGTTGVIGAVSAANSLVGSTANDRVGFVGVTALSNGNYVVTSPLWNNGAIVDAGAATWASGTTGVIGTISAANSLVGSTAGDQVGGGEASALSNGNYVVRSPDWNNGAVVDAGAVTWGGGGTGITGAVSAANSLVGSAASDRIGSHGVTALTNGNYVVRSTVWNNGAVVDVGAVTWGSGTTGVTGAVSAANSLVGSTASDRVGGDYDVTALSNGNYVVTSESWDNGATVDAGAVTWGSGATGVSGAVSAANSLVGSTANDMGFVKALTNGNYVVVSPSWNNGAIVDAGAVTWGSGTAGVTGAVSAANSLVGSTASDFLGTGGGTIALPNGNYVVRSENWDNGGLANAGAATWGSGVSGVTGTVSPSNSLVGTTANAGLQQVSVDKINGTFIAQFRFEGGGRVRVGAQDIPVFVSALDLPNDQGGWLRLTFLRSAADAANGSLPVTTYGVWRHLPGTIPARTGKARPGAALKPAPNVSSTERLRRALPTGLDVVEAEGRFYVNGPGTRAAGITALFPAGTWELVTIVPALQMAQYAVAVPTISNAAANDFVLTAHTATPWIWFASDPVSGQSVDNLAPAVPSGLSAAYANGQTNLQWAASTENDFDSYSLYRGGSADFVPAIGNRIATPTATSYADVGPAGGYYKLSTVDVNANESGFALVTPQGTTGVGEGTAVAFALEGARPNPASRHALLVAFALPTGAAARIDLLDVSGRRILAREVGSLGAGRHAVNLAEGRSVPAGLYWVRLTQGPNRQTTPVAVIE